MLNMKQRTVTHIVSYNNNNNNLQKQSFVCKVIISGFLYMVIFFNSSAGERERANDLVAINWATAQILL